MGGEGSMASAISSLKQNRALLKKRKIKDLKDLLYENSGKTKLEFKKVSHEELEVIKAKIRTEAKKRARKEIVLYLICSVIVIGGLYWLFYM